MSMPCSVQMPKIFTVVYCHRGAKTAFNLQGQKGEIREFFEIVSTKLAQTNKITKIVD